MNKSEIVASILDRLREEFESRSRVSKTTRDGGNDAESKAEGKYDTLSIEENYLADGLARQALAAAEAIAEIEKMPLRTFAGDDPIDLGALVEVEFPGAREWFFLAPSGGGTEVRHEGTAVTVITPESPLGSQLIGSRVGDRTSAPAAKIVWAV
ncbi:MAG: transcription elongation factor GreAB [Verrucomicrobia bacterium]|nr:transcription elongation factor GreAB [Verrucomicrobiota bacterium]